MRSLEDVRAVFGLKARGFTDRQVSNRTGVPVNTIRTWDALDPEELALAKENGLMVLQGIWLDPKEDFSDPHNQQAAIAQVQAVAENLFAAVPGWQTAAAIPKCAARRLDDSRVR